MNHSTVNSLAGMGAETHQSYPFDEGKHISEYSHPSAMCHSKTIAPAQAVLLPLQRSCQNGMKLRNLKLLDHRGHLAYPFFEMLDYNKYFKPMLGLESLTLETWRLHLPAAFQALSCLTTLKRLSIASKCHPSEFQVVSAQLQLPQLRNCRLEAATLELDLHLCPSLTEITWTQPDTPLGERRLWLPAGHPPKHTDEIIVSTPLTCSIITDTVVDLTKPQEAMYKDIDSPCSYIITTGADKRSFLNSPERLATSRDDMRFASEPQEWECINSTLWRRTMCGLS
eukprot:jgi/Botrbrau1/21078/Bobra.0144s0076.1